MKVQEFLTRFHCCKAGVNYAQQYEDMADVWDNCLYGSWLMFIYERIAPDLSSDITKTVQLIKAALPLVKDARPKHASAACMFDDCITKVEAFLSDPHKEYPDHHYGTDPEDMSPHDRMITVCGTLQSARGGLNLGMTPVETDALKAAAYLLEATTEADAPNELIGSALNHLILPSGTAVDLIKSIIPNPFR